MTEKAIENAEGHVVRTTDGRLFLVIADQGHRYLAVRVKLRHDGVAPFEVMAPRDERLIRAAGCALLA